ncbi:GNAT family N-acetyltransferase [Kitasatospora sp. A2-31]|uniref:GNAT family N-acetyltransferase n=1 Tax=Kitasatospora sp. A2-31 TaxID=2916414 RepID=UPI001EEBA3A5|nr:GNAT family N-acetyltransferase [Kitasatospora sp. A2-31]MCG6495202.1 GNAT family N-acetyltransferase [Kitasatospora sp. A2-31]
MAETPDGIRIRPLAPGDWDGVVALEERAYAASGLSEGRAALESRGRASPDTCFALEYRGRFGGYLLALPYPLYRCPDLSRAEAAGPDDPAAAPDNMHAHDLVIAEELRGRGLASVMLDHLAGTARARGFATVSLVAVRGSDVLWAPLGYRADPSVELPASYGDRAVYMSMSLAATPTVPDAAPHAYDLLAGSAPRVEVG